MTDKKIPFLLTLIALLFAGSFTVHSESAPEEKLDGITKPVSDIKLSFVQPGKIRQIMVKEGDLVQVGDILMHQNDEIELIQQRILKSKSTNRGPVNLAKVDLEQKRKDLENIKQAQIKGAITQWEVDHAALAVQTALLTMKIREFEHGQDMLKLESIEQSIKRLTLTSPIEGSVEEILIEPGEAVQALVPVIRIVKKDPLIIDLPVPVDQAKELTGGQQPFVQFAEGNELFGKIIKISSVADAAATTLGVKIELPNSENRPAGERVTVRFATDH